MKYSGMLFIAVVVMLVTSCSDERDPKPLNENLEKPEVGADVPPNSMATTMGPFTSYAHGLSGKAIVYTNDQGKRTLRLENFTMSAGPDVYVLFSKANNYSEANTIAISMLKDGYSDENLNINVPDSVDLTSHKFVLVYCVQFNSLFGFAELKQ